MSGHDEHTESHPSRREALGMMAGAAAGTGMDFDALQAALADQARAGAHARAAKAGAVAGQVYEPRFFEPGEWTALRMLVDLIIPEDERSGSATDAGVPEYIDFLMAEGDDGQAVAVRGGFAWLDAASRNRFDAPFVGATDAQRRAILDDIAWPERAAESSSHGVAFFTRMRDLTASGFWSSRMGVDDLQYIGNFMIPVWNGCPDEQLERLGVERPAPRDTNDHDSNEQERDG